METHHNHQHHPHKGISSSSVVHVEASDNRFPQWSIQETKEFLMIRAELDRTFMETKRNKLLWEAMSTRMREKGFNRSPEQCKCKWKNLVTRYKGCETVEAESMRQQFPFYSEMQAIFAARMQRMLWIETEGAGGTSQKRAAHLSSDDDQEENDESDGEIKIGKNKKSKKGKSVATNEGGHMEKLKEILEGFMEQQMRMEVQWREAWESREEERMRKEMEWRQTMEAWEKERMMMEKRWKEREEQRRLREEARAEKRDALITAILNKLRREEMQ